MRLRIRSEGLACNTVVEDADTGEPLEGVTAISWSVAVGDMTKAVIHVDLMHSDVVGEVAK